MESRNGLLVCDTAGVGCGVYQSWHGHDKESLTLVYLLAQILLGNNSNGSDATSDNAEATHNGTDHTQQGASMQDNGDMPVADDSPTDLSVHVQLSCTPCKLLSHMFFVHSRTAVQSNGTHMPYSHSE